MINMIAIDKKIWKSLEKVKISEKIKSLPKKLDYIWMKMDPTFLGSKTTISLARHYFTKER